MLFQIEIPFSSLVLLFVLDPNGFCPTSRTTPRLLLQIRPTMQKHGRPQMQFVSLPVSTFEHICSFLNPFWPDRRDFRLACKYISEVPLDAIILPHNSSVQSDPWRRLGHLCSRYSLVRRLETWNVQRSSIPHASLAKLLARCCSLQKFRLELDRMDFLDELAPQNLLSGLATCSPSLTSVRISGVLNDAGSAFLA